MKNLNPDSSLKIARYGLSSRTGKMSSSLFLKKAKAGPFVLFESYVVRISNLNNQIKDLKKRIKELEGKLSGEKYGPFK